MSKAILRGLTKAIRIPTRSLNTSSVPLLHNQHRCCYHYSTSQSSPQYYKPHNSPLGSVETISPTTPPWQHSRLSSRSFFSTSSSSPSSSNIKPNNSKNKMSLPLTQEITAPNGVKYTQPLGLFINNEFVKSKAGNTLSTVNPTTEEEICKVYAAEAEDVDIAVKAARKAFKDPSWRDIATIDRGMLLFRLADLVERDMKILATIETMDNGKPFNDARDVDLAEVLGVFRHYAGWADKIYGRTIDTSPAKFAYTRHEPIGVCGQIIPWNYPLSMAAWKLGPALATGNVVVLKSAEQTPLSVLYLAQLIKEAGFPPGVVNIISGYGKSAGAALVDHPGVDKIAFTGSTATGKMIMKAASATMKNITLETGGKSPIIIFDDADLDQAVKWAHIGIMSNMGQICTATSRIYVQEGIYEKFLEAFKEHITKTSIVGDPFDEKTFQGPQISKDQHEKILSYVEAGLSEGANLVTGGKRHGDKGYFIQPTVFSNVKDEMKISREEIFGPFACVSSFKTQEEVIDRANDTTYGLGSAVFTQNLELAHRVAAQLETGMVWINSSQDGHFGVPFGGNKQSGIGRELGEYGLTNYTNPKAVHVNMGTRL